ncbi:methyl-accepting chemotaxis protein [Tepidimonas sp.]|uniref:methyl-accepting chemotaxis protein n=1 Tax=Tepidimonas sp. TaxID=2002775 RepID=UPI0040549FF1
MTFVLLAQQWAALRTTENSLTGALTVAALAELIFDVQLHRDLTNRVHSGDTQAQAQLQPVRERISKALRASDAALSSELLGRASRQLWPDARARLLALTQDRAADGAAASFARHTQLIDDLMAVVRDVAEGSELILDPEPNTYLLQDLWIERLLPAIEDMDVLRVVGATALARSEVSMADRTQLAARVAFIARTRRLAHQRFGALARHGVNAPSEWSSLQQTAAAFLQAVQSQLLGPAPQGDAQSFLSAGTRTTEAVAAVARWAQQTLIDGLRERYQRLQRQIVAETILVISVLLGMAWVVTKTTAGIRRDVQQVLRLTNAQQSGDLTTTVAIHGSDELADMLWQLHHTQEKTAHVIRRIQEAAQQVAQASVQISAANQDLAMRTQQQTIAVQQTHSTIEHMVQGFDATQQHTAASVELVRESAQATQAVDRVVEVLLRTLGTLAESSAKIREITSIIDGIAFQTNILALNAAVEAARAGEAGRGFAVVAAEVRALARRSADAAKEIGAILHGSVQTIDLGVQQAQQARKAATDAAAQDERVLEAITAIHQHAQAHASSAAQIRNAIQQLDEISARNAAQVEQTSAAVQHLSDQVQAVHAQLSRFKIVPNA